MASGKKKEKAKPRIPRALPGLVRRAKQIVIVTHRNPDGDAVGSLLGLRSALRRGGKRVAYLLPTGAPARYDYLFRGAGKPLKCFKRRADITFVLDCADLSRVAGLVSIPRPGVVVNIDHHQGNSLFGELNMVERKASCAAELVDELIRACGLPLPPIAAECLYTGLLTDTGSFNHASTGVGAFRLAARLVAGGASPARVAGMVFQRRSAGENRLLGRVLSGMKFEYGGRVAWSFLRQRDLAACGVREGDVESEDYLGHLRALAGVKLAVLFRQRRGGEVRVSLRAKPGWRVDRLAASFGGGGHKYAAGCTLRGGIAVARRQLLTQMKKAFPRLARSRVSSHGSRVRKATRDA